MKKFAAVALASLAVASTPTLAADLFGTAPPPLGEPASNPQVEIGSNWYIRGDLGYGEVNSPTVVPTAGLIPQLFEDVPGTGAIFDNSPIGNPSNNVPVTRGNNRSNWDGMVDVGLGFRLNNFVRLEATYNFWNGPGLSYSHGTLCPSTTAPVSNTELVTTVQNGVSQTNTAQVPVGYLWDPVPCRGYLNASQYNNLGLASAYFDLGNFWGVTPYVGLGGGLNANTISGSTSFYVNSSGVPFIGNTTASGSGPLQWVVQTSTDANGNPVYTALSHQPNVLFTNNLNWNRHFSSTKYSYAGALMAGFGYQLTPSTTIDIGYRFVDLDLSGSTHNTAQQLTIGVRYMLN